MTITAGKIIGMITETIKACRWSGDGWHVNLLKGVWETLQDVYQHNVMAKQSQAKVGIFS